MNGEMAGRKENCPAVCATQRDACSPDVAVVKGTRIRMSVLGALRNPRLAGREGAIVGSSRMNRSVRILFDGRRTPISLHPDYIEAMK